MAYRQVRRIRCRESPLGRQKQAALSAAEAATPIWRPVSTLRKRTGSLDFAGLDDLLGYALRRAQGAVHRDYMASLGSARITQKQTAVLWLVQSNPGVTQGTIGNALGMDRATIMALVNRLSNRGLVKRRRSRADARRRELHLTAAGAALLGQVRLRIAHHERRMKQLLSDAELRKLKVLLTRLQSLER
jgi:DNA-binding MarR family transcriptional regulator